jgi:type I restriction enzyme S subunit
MNYRVWQSKPLGELVVFSGGSQPPKSSFSAMPEEGYVRLIQIRDYKSNDYTTYIPKQLAKKFCSVDDIMIGRYGPPIFQILRGLEGAYNVALMKAIPNDEVTKDYLYYFLQQKPLFLLIDRFSRRSAGQAGVDLEALREFEFPLPEIAEQRAITRALDKWSTAIKATHQLLAIKLTRKRGLMQQLLTGKIRFSEFRSEQWRKLTLGEIVTSAPRITPKPKGAFLAAGVRSHGKGVFL